jgi:hypothetical protein
MRTFYFGPFVLLCLLLILCVGCNRSQGHAPPPLDKDLLIGKWDADEPEQFIQSCEFAADRSCKLTLKSVPEIVPGMYSWTGETKLTLEYRPSEEAQKNCKVFLKKLKAAIREKGENSPGSTGPALANSANQYPDELPAKEEMRVGLADRYGPVLILTTESGLNFRFKKPKANGQ